MNYNLEIKYVGPFTIQSTAPPSKSVTGSCIGIGYNNLLIEKNKKNIENICKNSNFRSSLVDAIINKIESLNNQQTTQNKNGEEQ